MGELVHFTASPSGTPDGLVYYDWGLECGVSGPFDWTTHTAGGGFDRVFKTVGEHSVCVRAYDNTTSFADATTFDVAAPGNHPPVAALTVTPPAPAVNAPVTFDASGSTDPDLDTLRYRFDLDGVPGYEVDNGTESKVTQTYAANVVLTAGVQVKDPSGATATATVNVVIGDRPLAFLLAASMKGRKVRARVRTGRDATVVVDVRTPDATLVGHRRAKTKARRGRTLTIPLKAAHPRVVVIARATDANGVSARVVRRIKARR